MIAPAPTLHPALVPVSAGRWTPSRKEGVVLALLNREITIAEACEAHGLSAEEIAGWVRRFEDDGRRGLRITRRERLAA